MIRIRMIKATLNFLAMEEKNHCMRESMDCEGACIDHQGRCLPFLPG